MGSDGRGGPHDHLILAGTNADVRRLNRLARAAREHAGLLAGDGVPVDGGPARVGDRLLFTRNDRALGVSNGLLGEVTAADPGAGVLRVRLDDSRSVLVAPADYPHLAFGYAVTTHKAQGVTVDHVYALVGDGPTDRESAYTQASRGRQSARFFVPAADGDALAALADRMSRSNRKELAIELARSLPDAGPEWAR